MFEEDYGTINVNGSNIEIKKLSVEELNKYLSLFKQKEDELANKQNEYLSRLIG